MRPEAIEESRRLAHRYLLSAYRAQMQGNFEKALRLYRRSVDAYPTAAALTFMGWAMSLLGRFEDAIACCKRAIAMDPDFGNPYNDIGAYLLELDRPVEAIPWLKEALAERRTDSPHFPHYNLGRAYEKLMDRHEAELHYRQAALERPDYELARQALRRIAAWRN
jgi:tetratricopeptide (TPR) repeat protein